MSTPAGIVATRALAVRYRRGAGEVEALRGVDLELWPGRVLALVGESGSGKSTLGAALMGLLPPSAQLTGAVEVGGRVLAPRDERAWQALRGGTVAWVPQDPLSALDPLLPVGEQAAEGPRFAEGLAPAAARERAREALVRAGLRDPDALYGRFPHQLSGGQRQRALLACALARRPRALIADEPTSALDPTLALHVIATLRQLARIDHLAVLWITHDLGAALSAADELAVLQAGRVVERGSAAGLGRAPAHPHTRALIAAARALSVLPGGAA